MIRPGLRSALSDASSLPKDLELLLFLTRVFFSFLENFQNEKHLSSTFSMRECVCANVFCCHHVFGCAWSSSIVHVCLRSVNNSHVFARNAQHTDS